MRIAAAIIATLFTAATADEQGWMAKCAEHSQLAADIMETRQAGVSMQDVMEVMNEAAGDAANPLVIAAYEKPRLTTPENQQRLIDDFRDAAYLACTKTLGE